MVCYATSICLRASLCRPSTMSEPSVGCTYCPTTTYDSCTYAGVKAHPRHADPATRVWFAVLPRYSQHRLFTRSSARTLPLSSSQPSAFIFFFSGANWHTAGSILSCCSISPLHTIAYTHLSYLLKALLSSQSNFLGAPQGLHQIYQSDSEASRVCTFKELYDIERVSKIKLWFPLFIILVFFAKYVRPAHSRSRHSDAYQPGNLQSYNYYYRGS